MLTHAIIIWTLSLKFKRNRQLVLPFVTPSTLTSFGQGSVTNSDIKHRVLLFILRPHSGHHNSVLNKEVFTEKSYIQIYSWIARVPEMTSTISHIQHLLKRIMRQSWQKGAKIISPMKSWVITARLQNFEASSSPGQERRSQMFAIWGVCLWLSLFFNLNNVDRK